MKILVTGAKGFVGKNLVLELKNRGFQELFECDVDTTPEELDRYTRECEFVYHLAGVNRPQDESEFMTGNFGFTGTLVDLLKKQGNKSPLLLTSSIQASLDNPYGRSKKAGEELIFAYGKENNIRVLVYRLPGLFGKWCRPNYNSVVATFCHNIARDLPIQVNDPASLLRLSYIDDVVSEFIAGLEQNEQHGNDGFCHVQTVYEVKLGELAKKLQGFWANRKTLVMPSLIEPFDRALYATLLSYLPPDQFSYALNMQHDNRGWLAEIIKSHSFGQIFVSKTKPGITRGNHWHHTKIEKFAVIQGEAVIKFRKVDNDKADEEKDAFEYRVSGDRIKVLDIPVGYTHSITSVGNSDLITLFWADEIYNPEKPDTFYLEV